MFQMISCSLVLQNISGLVNSGDDRLGFPDSASMEDHSSWGFSFLHDKPEIISMSLTQWYTGWKNALHPIFSYRSTGDLTQMGLSPANKARRANRVIVPLIAGSIALMQLN